MWIAICRHCGRPAFCYPHNLKPGPDVDLGSYPLRWFNSAAAVKPGESIPRCQTCKKQVTRWKLLDWVKPSGLVPLGNRQSYKRLLASCARIVSFLGELKADERLPEDVRDRAGWIYGLIKKFQSEAAVTDKDVERIYE